MARSWWLDIALLVAGIAAGVVLPWPFPPAGRPLASTSSTSSRPPAPGVLPEGPRRCDVLEEMRHRRLTAIEQQNNELGEDIAALREEGFAAGALPWPFPDPPEPHMTPEAVEAALQHSRESRPDWEGWHASVDCSEYPCLVLYEADYDDLGSPPFAGFEGGYGAIFGIRRHIFHPLPKAGIPEDLRLRLDVRTSALFEEDR